MPPPSSKDGPLDPGEGHEWSPFGESNGERWREFEKYVQDYSMPPGAGSLRPARYFCENCHIFVPDAGPREEDRDCGLLYTRLVMDC